MVNLEKAKRIILKAYKNRKIIECLEFDDFYAFGLADKKFDKCSDSIGGAYFTVNKTDGKIGVINLFHENLNFKYASKETHMTADIWTTLYNKATAVQRGRVISPFIEAGGVAAAILTKKGNIYVGVCIDTASGLGMCAERNAMANMITFGEHEMDKVVAVMPDGRVGSPCGACREFMMQLSRDSGEIEILTDIETKTTVKLKELMPDWWGKKRFE